MYLPQRFQNSVKLNDSKGFTSVKILILEFQNSVKLNDFKGIRQNLIPTMAFQNSVKLNDSKGSNRCYTMRENKKLIEQTCVGNRNCRGQ